ncbi:hypothetical protein Sjap_008974 [Stephania japonica]|uniref:R13L1/DRL21-like LRR repeat region domain-containing protein n=1 Tax=Stephania japonica TaxID=461633 RepID=A0AAP0JRF0_9MAGN
MYEDIVYEILLRRECRSIDLQYARLGARSCRDALWIECNGAGNANHVESNENLRHISLLSSGGAIEIPRDIGEAKKLRTFYLFHNHQYSHHTLKGTDLPKLLQLRLRVLDLSQTYLRELPSSIDRLKHLKYLNLSRSKIKKLPLSIIKLYNLQTFNISDCYELSELPESVATLTQLRHFYLYRNFNNHETPRGLSKLHFLQRLDILKLSVESASEHIEELEHLNHLGGTLQLQNLGNVNVVDAAKKANLMGKENLCKLDMDWKSVTLGNNISDNSRLLKALQPHKNLKELKICSFQGLELPWWMSNNSTLPNLVKLELRDCNKCTRIKSLGRLPILRELVLEEMSNLTTVGDDHHNHLQVAESSTTTAIEVEGPEAALILFPYLQKLSVRDVPNLEEWFENSADIFPKLEVLNLCGCPKLKNMPNHFPSLQKLVVGKVNSDTIRSMTDNITSLTSLSFEFEVSLSSSSSTEKEEEELVARMLGKNKLLEILKVKGLSSMRCLPDLIGLQLLRELKIFDCKALKKCPHLSPSLKKLSIENCRALEIESAQLPCLVESLWISDVKAFLVDDTLWSSKLSDLYIRKVPKFVQLPMDFLRNNMHLRFIEIGSCPQFEGFLSSNEEESRSSPDSPPPPSSSCCVEILELRDCPSILGLQLQGFTQLQYLTVVGCKGLQSLEGLQSLRNIQSLWIGRYSEELNDFPFLDAIEMGGHLISSLCYLGIYGWSCLKSLPEQIQHLSRLESLYINGFDGMENLPDWLGKLTSLETLAIRDCKNLKHLPSANATRKLTSLRKLEIQDCPLLKERCKPLKKRCGLCSGSSEWHKISHISQVTIRPKSSDSENFIR